MGEKTDPVTRAQDSGRGVWGVVFTCRLLDKDHVCDLVPCVRIHLEFTVGVGSERALMHGVGSRVSGSG